jgi:ABC-type uncharacterized transport system substrate-binding protein
MIGRILPNKFLFLLLAAVWLGGLPMALAAADSDPVVILVSDEEKAYSGPIESFIAEINQPVEIFNLKGNVERAPDIMGQIFSRNPRLIFALGAKAAVVSKVWTKGSPEIPVVFGMVLNWERYGLFDRQGNVAGIAYDVAAGTHLANLAMISPEINRIGVIYSREHSGRFIESARKSADILNLKLIEKPIENPQEFQRAFKGMEDRVDSYWILSDPIVYTLENISWLEDRCIKNRIICLGPSENVAKLGVVLSVDPDQKNIGVQAASMAKSILESGQRPGKIGIMPPIGTRLFINLKTANKIGLHISRNTLDQATRVIDR